MDRFETGRTFAAANGKTVTVKTLGMESDGVAIYDVDYGGAPRLLLWYAAPPAGGVMEARHTDMDARVKGGSPSKAFLWPEAIVEGTNGEFGCVMPYRPDGYDSITTAIALAGSGLASPTAVVELCIQMTSAFHALHKSGYCFRDMNSGNFLVKPATGALIVSDPGGVCLVKEANAARPALTPTEGMTGYMAPELVTGAVAPSARTDAFSLAVLLFMVLCHGHPLEGARSVKPVLTLEDERRLHGSEALFVFDPGDESNRPVPGVHGAVIAAWPALPRYVRGVFLRAFSQDAIRNPAMRVGELDWIRTLVRLRDDIVACPSCGKPLAVTDTEGTPCPSCGAAYRPANTLGLDGYSVPIAKGTRVYRCQVTPCGMDDALAPVMIVVAKPKDPSIMGLRNLTKNTLTGITPSGKRNLVKPGDIIPVKPGIRVQAFGGEIVIR